MGTLEMNLTSPTVVISTVIDKINPFSEAASSSL